jgi:hypothetical protein
MRCLIIAAFVAAFILVPTLNWAGDWEQVPSGGGEPSGQTAVPGEHGKPCEVVGMFANIVATLRDQGVTQERQFKDVDATLNKAAGEKHLPDQIVGAMGGVLRNEVSYAYEHREMTPDQVKEHWTGLCEQGGRAQGSGE